MSSKLKSQNLENVEESQWSNVITAEVPKGNFIAITSNKVEEGSSQRVITVEEMELDVAEGGTLETETGVFVRQEGETSVKVVLTDDGKEIDSIEMDYPG